jgi:MFS family permease
MAGDWPHICSGIALQSCRVKPHVRNARVLIAPICVILSGGESGGRMRQEGWLELMRGRNAARSAVVGGGMIIHAVSTFIVVTILPSVVRDIGGLRFFAWNTTLYVLASLLAGALCARLLARVGARGGYRVALPVFALGALICALAPSMPVLLVGRLIQGLGAGTLSALSFSMVRTLFNQALWSRALSLTSAAWGVATLAGPAIGGAFAQYHAWRAAFWSVFALTPFLLLLVERSLPRDLPRPDPPRTPLALLNLCVLAGSVLAVSVASSVPQVVINAIGLATALFGLGWFLRLEASASRLLPYRACSPATALGAAYTSMVLLLIGVTTEMFVPYFLQTLHGVTPLHAGYLSALMSAGWTAGAVGGSSQRTGGVRALLTAGPLLLAAALAGLFLLLPEPGIFGNAQLWAIGACLFGQGLGMGIAWPHLCANVFVFAPEREKDLAATSITVVIMVANAFGTALGGMVTNLAGMTIPGGPTGAALSATWLFGTYTLAPLVAFLTVQRLLRFRARAPMQL